MKRKLKLGVGRRIFLIFLIVWLGCIAVAFCFVMLKFKEWLIDYQYEYDNSRPYLKMDEYYKWFQDADIDTIYDNLSEKPFINEYETDANPKLFMTNLLHPTNITYTESNNYTEPLPEYMILDGDYIVSTLRLKKSDSATKKYSFPVWELTYLDYYCEPQYDVYISVPETVSVSVNGMPLDEKYCYEISAAPAEQEMFDGYAVLPLTKYYKIENFYQRPEITAINEEGFNAPVIFNENTGVYEIGYGDFPDTSTMKEAAIANAKSFASFFANENSQYVMRSYFVNNCEILNYIINGRANAGNYFKLHSSVSYSNAEVDRFICYNSDTFSCDVHMDQEIYRYGDTPIEIATLNYRFFYVKIDGVWKACYVTLLAHKE